MLSSVGSFASFLPFKVPEIPSPEKITADLRNAVANMPEADLLRHAETIRRAVLWATEGVE
ncbi:MAG: hypothetical protein ACYCSN_14665 [Acidobacteriaceae bacterium]